jgi:hypothetical protein
MLVLAKIIHLNGTQVFKIISAFLIKEGQKSVNFMVFGLDDTVLDLSELNELV